MNRNLVKRFFAEEDGMEVMQVVMIAAIAVCVILSVWNIYQSNMHTKILTKINELLNQKPQGGNGGGTTTEE